MKQNIPCENSNCDRTFKNWHAMRVHKAIAHKNDPDENEIDTRPKRLRDLDKKRLRPNGDEIDRAEFQQAFPEMLVQQMGWNVLAIDRDRHTMIVAVPLGE